MGWGNNDRHVSSAKGSRSDKGYDRGESQYDDKRSRRRMEKKQQLQATFESLIMYIGAEESYKGGITKESLVPFLESLYSFAAGARNRPLLLPIGVGYSGEAQRMLPEGFKVSTSGPGSVASDYGDDQPPLDLRVTADKVAAAKYTVTGIPTHTIDNVTPQNSHTLPTVPESSGFNGPFVHEPTPRRNDAYASSSRLSTPTVNNFQGGNYRFSTNAAGPGRRNYDRGVDLNRGFDP